MYDRETPSRLTSIRGKKTGASREKIGEMKKQEGRVDGSEGENGAVTSSWAIVLRNFMRARLAGTVGERAKSISHKSIYLYPFVPRAQLTSLRESRLTRFATIIQPFRIHFSYTLPQFTAPVPPCMKTRKGTIVELRDIYGPLIPEGKDLGSLALTEIAFF